jgi:hypothetical protein
MKPNSLRDLARRIRETASEMSHHRSREISEKIARDLEKRAAELEQSIEGTDERSEAPQDDG